jgi:acetoin utilization protein AcuB
VIDCFSQTKSIKTPGGVVILSVKEKDYSLSEISGIVESNDGQILSASLNQTQLNDELEITLKINKIDLSRILASFYRLNYTVKAAYHSSELTNDLEDRYNAFMTYLNV